MWKTRNIMAEKNRAICINLHKLGITLVHFKQYGNIILKLETWRKKHIYRHLNQMLTYCVVWGDNWTGNKITAQRISIINPLKLKWVFCVSSRAQHFVIFLCICFKAKETHIHSTHSGWCFFWMRTWLNEIKRGVSLSFQCCTDENKERTEGEPLFIFSVRGEPLFLLSDSDIDTNRHQSNDVTSLNSTWLSPW